jgi:hypothetical protein
MNSINKNVKSFFTNLISNYPKVLFWTILSYIAFFLYYQYFLSYISFLLLSNIESYFLYNLINVLFSYPIILIISYVVIKFNFIIDYKELKSNSLILTLKFSLVIIIALILFALIEELYYIDNLFLIILAILLYLFIFGLLFFSQKGLFKKDFFKTSLFCFKNYANSKSLFAYLIFLIVLLILYVIYVLSMSFLFFDLFSVLIFAFVIYCFVKFSTY